MKARSGLRRGSPAHLLCVGVFFLSMVANAATVTVTAYCTCKECCGKWSNYNRTASGAIPTEGVTCAASRSIPFGTRLHIAGVGVRVVQDRLARVYDGRVDIFMSSHNQAKKFGKRKLNVSVLAHIPQKPRKRVQLTR